MFVADTAATIAFSLGRRVGILAATSGAAFRHQGLQVRLRRYAARSIDEPLPCLTQEPCPMLAVAIAQSLVGDARFEHVDDVVSESFMHRQQVAIIFPTLFRALEKA